MEEIIINNFRENENFQPITIEKLHTELDSFDIQSISIDEGSIIRLSDEMCCKILENDLECPIVLDKITKTLKINPTWYLNNQEVADETINYICKYINKKELSISTKALITDNLIKSICQNKTIEKIILTKYSEDKYKLSEKHYKMFKNSNIKKIDTNGVEKELEENYDSIISYNVDRPLIGFYKYKDLINKDKESLHFKDIKEEELPILKYLNHNKSIRINETDIKTIELVSNKLTELRLKNNIIIEVRDKNTFNNYIFNTKLNYKNISIYTDDMIIDLKKYLKYEKKLYKFIEPAKKLSPFERYIYAYNSVKKFKEYKENEKDRMSARRLYEILENKFMVCVGFAELFEDLLSKLGIQSMKMNIDVDTSYDKISDNKNEELGKPVIHAKHARVYIYIKDEKYGIDGFYISDPTWDNNLEKDYYNYLAITEEEITNNKRYNWINTYESDELMNITSIEEFYQKIKFITTRKNGLFYEKKPLLIDKLIKDKISILDKEFYNKLIEKYQFIEKETWPENINDLIYDLGEYIVKHTNKEILGSTIIEAIKNVYKYGYNYTDEKIEEILPKIIEENKKRQIIEFPTRFKEDKEVVMNEHNKFDIDYPKQKK